MKTLDLYAENFDPILRFDQEHRRRDLHKDPEIAKYRDLITWADHLIFIFPYLVERYACHSQRLYRPRLCG